MNVKTLISTLLLLGGIGGAMLYLQTTEAEKIERTVLKAEAQKEIVFTARDFDIAAYVMYYKNPAFYTAEEATFYSQLDIIGRQTAMQYMYKQKINIDASQIQLYKQQAKDEVAYEQSKEAQQLFFEQLQQQLDVTPDDYAAYVYKIRISDIMYEQLSREQRGSELEMDAFFQFWESQLPTYELSEASIEEKLAQIEALMQPSAEQPNWLIHEDGQELVMEHQKTKAQQMKTHAINDLYAFTPYAPILSYVERQIGTKITRSTIDAAVKALHTYETNEQQEQAYEDLQQIFMLYAQQNTPL